MVRTTQPQKLSQKSPLRTANHKDAVSIGFPLSAAWTPAHDFLERKRSVVNARRKFAFMSLRCRAIPPLQNPTFLHPAFVQITTGSATPMHTSCPRLTHNL